VINQSNDNKGGYVKKQREYKDNKKPLTTPNPSTTTASTAPPVRKPTYNPNRDTRPNTNLPVLSVVIPLYNEEESLPELALQLETEIKKIPNIYDKYEVIFIDDGSTDDSFEVIKTIKRRNPRFKAIRFRRNYGKSAALAVGFKEARGILVATMDADLQDDPAELENLVNKLKEGYDLVTGWKKKRHDPISKTIPSKFFNFVTSIVSGIKLHDFNCGLKLYRKEVVQSLNIYGEMHRYIPALAKANGFKIAETPIIHHARRYGKSKFGFSRFIKGFLDLLTFFFTSRYLKRPLHFFGTLGVLMGLAGLGINIYLTVEWYLGKTFLSNRPLALLGIALIIVGVQLVSMGLLGEMIAKNNSVNQQYNIKERL
jgi:glycosyltransferase involved in cell wall biosynthesis